MLGKMDAQDAHEQMDVRPDVDGNTDGEWTLVKRKTRNVVRGKKVRFKEQKLTLK